MTNYNETILCGSCRVPLQGSTGGQAQDLFACPSCGISDTRENVIAEVEDFATETAQRSLQEYMRRAARGSKMLQFKGKPIPKKIYRFSTNNI